MHVVSEVTKIFVGPLSDLLKFVNGKYWKFLLDLKKRSSYYFPQDFPLSFITKQKDGGFSYSSFY